MSTVPPPPAVLPLLGDELLLLLQPAAAKAITARAAIAVVRFIIFIFPLVGSGHPAAVKRAGWPPSGAMPLPQPRAGRRDQVFLRGQTRLVIDSHPCPERGKHHREHNVRRFAAFWEQASPRCPGAVVLQRARLDLTLLALEEHAKVLSRGCQP